MVNPWFIVETVHFFLGALGCTFFPKIVINSYSINRDPIQQQGLELVEVLSSFYIAFTAMGIVAIVNDDFSHWYSMGLFIFYSICMVWDMKTIINLRGKYPGYRILDTSIHVVMFAGNLIYFLGLEN
jgi:hypothetical protein